MARIWPILDSIDSIDSIDFGTQSRRATIQGPKINGINGIKRNPISLILLILGPSTVARPGWVPKSMKSMKSDSFDSIDFGTLSGAVLRLASIWPIFDPIESIDSIDFGT